MSILEQIKPIFEEKFLFEGELKDDMRLREDLGLDSLDFIEIVTNMEDLFHVEIPDEDLIDLETVGDVVNYIESHIN